MSPLVLIFVVVGLVQIAGLVLFLNTAAAELFLIAESLSFVQSTWVSGPIQNIKTLSYFLIVPIFIVDYLVYAVVAGVTREKQQMAKYRRGRL
ncbi:hypothetical protein ACH9L7_20285 (plasmid) [Haloferax sp. S1W]|uniref:hypothetical protein n=1 Tax=Haloferax sp. S1W TaxID=3377110 RepID=UPI0037C9F49F